MKMKFLIMMSILAHREFRDAMRAAMLKADPSIQPILNKLPPPDRRGITQPREDQ